MTHTSKKWQAGWFLRPDCAPRSECPQFGMPAERRAQFRVPNVPRSRMSERAPFRIYEHAQCRVFERTSLQRAYVIPCQQQMGSSAVLQACRNALVLAEWTVVSCPYLRYGDRGRLHNVSPTSVLVESSLIFLQYTWDSDAKKWWTRILKFKFCDFVDFFNFQKGVARSLCGRSGLLWSRPN